MRSGVKSASRSASANGNHGRSALTPAQGFSAGSNGFPGFSLIAAGITSARNLQNFRFFTNDFETRTRGIDLVATYAPPGGGTTVNLLYNRTDTEVVRFDPATLNAARIRQLREALPGRRWNVTVNRLLGRLRLLGRVSWYGGWFDARDNHA